MLGNQLKISGFDSEHSMRHYHCTNCGKRIDYTPQGSRIKSVATGIGIMAAGGISAFLLYPSLNVYALQLGFFATLFSAIKIFMRL